MLSELIRAVGAALLVGVVPGWFWAKLLRGACTTDRAECLAYSLALSITLVPTVMLVPTRLFETGVSLGVAVGAPLVVFISGMVLYVWLGPAKGSDEPLCAAPQPLGSSALVLVVVAFGLALGVMAGVVPGAPGAILVTLLVLSGGMAWLLSPPGPNEARAGERPVAPAVRYAALSAVLLLVLLRGYLGPLLHDWPYPRGVDRYEHAVMTGMTLSEGTTESFMLYPPGLHFLTAGICRLSGLEPLEVFPLVAPTLLLLPALACYALAKRLWGPLYGVVAALLSGLILGGTYLHFAEARYANFIGSQFLMVVAVAALVGLYAAPSVRGGLLFAALGSSTVLYHQIAGYSLAVLVAVVGVVFVPYLLVRERRKGVALLLSLGLLGILSALYAWDTYDLPRLVAGLLGGSKTGRGGEAVAMAIGTKPAFDLGHLLATTSQPVAWLGLLGALLVIGDLLRNKRAGGVAQKLSYLTLLYWAVLLFAGSRTPLSGFPDRFERDLGIPLAVLAAFAFVAVLRSLRPGKPAVLAVTLPAALLAITLVGVQAVMNLELAAGPSPRLKDRPPPPEVAAAGRWLKEHNSGGNIVATPYLAYVPSRGMLAMGGYTGMQSYDAPRIRRARDLPPFGAGPLWDALWVLQHPEGERTQRILEENDVRYLVFYKGSGLYHLTIDWRPFERRRELYRVVFENEGVIIFEPREN